MATMKYKILPFAVSIFIMGSLVADDYYYKSGPINSGGTWAKGSWEGTLGELPGENDTAYFTTQSNANYAPFEADFTVGNVVIQDITERMNFTARGHTFNVNGNVTVNESMTTYFNVQFGMNSNFGIGTDDGFKHINIGGDYITNGNTLTKFCFSGDSASDQYYSETNPSMKIGGAIKFTEAPAEARDYRMAINAYNGGTIGRTAFVQLGGFETGANKVLKLCNNDNGRYTTLVFKGDGSKPFSGGDASLMISDWYPNMGEGHINTVVDSGSGAALQTLRFFENASGKDGNNDNVSTARSEVAVKSGALNLYSEGKFKKISVSGGTLGVAGSAAADDEAGSFKTSELSLAGGELLFDAGRTASDFVEADAISGDLSTLIVIDLSVDDFNIGEDLAGFDFNLFRNVSGSVDWDSLVAKFIFDGVEQDFKGSFSNGVFHVDSGVIVVPEPAALAAMLGLAALALAACRRRK